MKTGPALGLGACKTEVFTLGCEDSPGSYWGQEAPLGLQPRCSEALPLTPPNSRSSLQTQRQGSFSPGDLTRLLLLAWASRERLVGTKMV